ncbi:MAG TPA: terminase gpA endonuclease subunit [Planctomycetota bacterium]|nr:terminase gpA endonuclease subunit [Planctomycetota bacterium]
MEIDDEREHKADYQRSRRSRQGARQRAETHSGQDIGALPDVEDWARRLACGDSFRLFCETYFAPAFWRPWSADHLRVIAKIERCILEGGLFAFAMPRGSGKTTLARSAGLWAVLYGYRPFVCLIGAADDRAKELLLPIKKGALENDMLLADFPDAVHALRALENSSKRQLQQHCNGRLTHVHWGQNKLVFPTIDEEDLPAALREAGLTVSPSCGSIITVTSLDANMRGQQHTRADGTVIRPALVMLDDPQTRESARSMDQTKKRLELLNGDVLGMAGPGEQISALMTCTKMYEGDLADTVLDHEKYPEWESECTKLVYEFPTDEKPRKDGDSRPKLWEQYFEVRRTKGKAAATEFYRERQAAMDAGAQVAWPARFGSKTGKSDEISAIQHAMNLRQKVGREAFAAEYQNEPCVQQTSDQILTVEQVLANLSGHNRGDVPPACTKLTMFIDVHDKLLFYAVCAWQEDFTGYVVDYGVFPDQRRPVFTLADTTHILRGAFPTAGTDGAIQAGMERLVAAYLARDWNRGGSLMRIDRLLVDMGYKPNIVAAVKQKAGGSAMMLAKGVGIRASRKPIAEYARRPGETIGHYWYVPNVRKTGQFPHVLVDVNYWKRFVHEAFATVPGDRGCLSLWGKDGKAHELLAEHVARSEKCVEVIGPGGVVREWTPWPTRPDNHWFDCLVGCAAAASMVGIKTIGQDAALPDRQRKRYTQADLARR